jgi:hypothetical protein
VAGVKSVTVYDVVDADAGARVRANTHPLVRRRPGPTICRKVRRSRVHAPLKLATLVKVGPNSRRLLPFSRRTSTWYSAVWSEPRFHEMRTDVCVADVPELCGAVQSKPVRYKLSPYTTWCFPLTANQRSGRELAWGGVKARAVARGRIAIDRVAGIQTQEVRLPLQQAADLARGEVEHGRRCKIPGSHMSDEAPLL